MIDVGAAHGFIECRLRKSYMYIISIINSQLNESFDPRTIEIAGLVESHSDVSHMEGGGGGARFSKKYSMIVDRLFLQLFSPLQLSLILCLFWLLTVPFPRLFLYIYI